MINLIRDHSGMVLKISALLFGILVGLIPFSRELVTKAKPKSFWGLTGAGKLFVVLVLVALLGFDKIVSRYERQNNATVSEVSELTVQLFSLKTELEKQEQISKILAAKCDSLVRQAGQPKLKDREAGRKTDH
jgi:hypothetical protein